MTAQLAAEKPTIKILLYTDDPQFSVSSRFDQFLGLGLMIERLHGHTPTFANLSTTLVNRSSDHLHHADNKLDAILDNTQNDPFDEIWFFGAHQANTPSGPQSELTSGEIDALNLWMKGKAADGSEGGGVLMTGDHANPNPFDLVANPDSPCGDMSAGVTFLGLGRAIGRCVPRAGLLRAWEGPPTSRAADSFSTVAGSGFQMDPVPQELFLENVNPDGDPDPNGEPHPLFFYKADQFIGVFPDHAHEGAVVVPNALDASWPTGSKGQTRPHVIARGRDRRDGKVLNIVAAYNGDLAGVGRIVADSTWHHYTNLNLLGFKHPAPLGSAADQIGQFYANLAVWLAPRHKRLAMARAMCWQVAQYTLLQEPLGDAESIGQTAQSVVMKAASSCETHELIQVLLPKQSEVLAEAAGETGYDYQPMRELFLGSVLELYHQAMVRARAGRQTEPHLGETTAQPQSMNQLIDVAFRRALNEQAKRLHRNLQVLQVAPNNKQM